MASIDRQLIGHNLQALVNAVSDMASALGTRTVRAASTTNVTLTSVSTSLDGITLVAGDRVLVKDQSTHSQNGIYVVGTVSGGNAPWTRAADMQAALDVDSGMLIGVSEGTVSANTIYQMTTAGWPGTKVLGTDTLDFGLTTSAALTSTAAIDVSTATADAAGTATTAARQDHAHKVAMAAGTNITLSSNAATIAVAAGRWRKVAAAALSGAGTITLSTSGAAANDVIEITRLDTTANTLAIVDGGTGTPTLCTLVASKLGFAKVAFDGTNWQLVSCSAT